MKTLFLSKNYYRLISVSLCFICILIFLKTEYLIPSYFKFLIFSILLVISLYFIPFSLIKLNNDQDKILKLFSKLILGITSGYLAVLTLVSSEEIFLAGKFLIIISSIFSIVILLFKNGKYKSMFISHSLIIFFLIGLTKMIN
jgi:hypothetical protein